MDAHLHLLVEDNLPSRHDTRRCAPRSCRMRLEQPRIPPGSTSRSAQPAILRDPAAGSALHRPHPAPGRRLRNLRDPDRRPRHRRRLHHLQRGQRPVAASAPAARSPQPRVDFQYPGRWRRRRMANSGRSLPRSAKAREVLLRPHGLQQLLRHGRRQTHGRWRGRTSHRRARCRKLFLLPRHPPAPRPIAQPRRMQVERPAGRHAELQLLAKTFRVRSRHPGTKAHPE